MSIVFLRFSFYKTLSFYRTDMKNIFAKNSKNGFVYKFLWKRKKKEALYNNCVICKEVYNKRNHTDK